MLGPPKKRANRNLKHGWLSSFHSCRRTPFIPEGGRMTNSACALAEARKSSNWLTCCDGTWTPERTARHIFRGIESLSHGYQHRMPAFGQALHCHGPGPDEHIQAAQIGRAHV